MQLPPIPRSPARVQQLRWIFSPMSYMNAIARQYGDIFSLQLRRDMAPIVFVSNPEALQAILASDTKHFSAPGELNKDFEPLFGKRSLITISGNQHQRQRQLLTPPLHGERMRGYADLINTVTAEVIDKLPIGSLFSIRNVTQTVTLQVMMQAVFGLSDSPRAKEIERLLGNLLDATSSPWIMAANYFPLIRNLVRPFTPARDAELWQKQADNLLYQEIQERRKSPDSSRIDILSLLMAARDETGEPMTDEELRDELITLLIAGHETTATAIAWALYLVYKHPNVKTKLLAELDSLPKNSDPNTICKLPYLNAVCNETLRIYPVGMLTFPRQVEVPISLCGYTLEPGTIIYGSIYLTHRRQDLYQNPEKFQPERFLERQFSPHEFLPFGGGVRRCIGLAFAQFEMKLVIAKMLSQVELEITNRGEIKPQRRGLVSGPNRTINAIIKNKRVINKSQKITANSQNIIA
jgi:cytochrome P450 family 110